jgi:hypothetical protein
LLWYCQHDFSFIQGRKALTEQPDRLVVLEYRVLLEHRDQPVS